MFGPDELERYSRHIILPEVGGAGQQALKKARVLVIGAGGLGSPLLLYLAAAGIGTLGIVDDDTVSLSNLQRQVLHGTEDIGRKKTESAAVGIAATVGIEEFERHLPTEPGVVGDVDLTRAAGSEPLAYVVVQDGLPGQRRC